MSYYINPGSQHGERYKGLFGNMNDDKNKAAYAKFLKEGITLTAPQKYDNNPYKSTNIMMSHVERVIRNEGSYESPFIQNGGNFNIYQNSRGQYVQEYTSWGMREVEENGKKVKKILPDPTQTTILNIVDPNELDALKITLIEGLNIIARKNINESK